MRTSDEGIAALEQEEGVVLKAYRCPAGRWTIGPGLTAASGVVTPKAGMVISRKEATRLLQLALQNNYEPTVTAAMATANQHEFDGGASFHFNTGAIGRASWVKHWRQRNWAGVRDGLRAWSKGGGKVLPGLQKRREREYRMMRFGEYAAMPVVTRPPGLAKISLRLGDEFGLIRLREALEQLGYDVGSDVRGVSELAVRAFQRDHDLTVDGIVGRATLATIERMLAARRKAAPAVGATAVTGTSTQTDAVPDATGLPDWAGWVALGLAALWLAWLAWTYRDAIAAKIQKPFPELARALRSI